MQEKGMLVPSICETREKNKLDRFSVISDSFGSVGNQTLTLRGLKSVKVALTSRIGIGRDVFFSIAGVFFLLGAKGLRKMR